jgi:SAM-dependent methyltransferase
MPARPAEGDYSSFARHYDLIYSQRQDDIPLYLDFAAAATGPILELGCGSGRVLLPMAREGHSLVGLDSSPEMLSLARARLQEAGLSENVVLVEGNLVDFNLSQRFELIYIPINTFMHCYTQAQQISCLNAIRRHLNPGGRLVIDVYHPDPQSLAECDGRLICENVFVDEKSGNTIQHSYSRRLDRAEQTQHITFILDETDSRGSVNRVYFSFRMRFVYRFEMELLLKMTGFSLEHLYGSYDLEPFDSSSEKMIFVARMDYAG